MQTFKVEHLKTSGIAVIVFLTKKDGKSLPKDYIKKFIQSLQILTINPETAILKSEFIELSSSSLLLNIELVPGIEQEFVELWFKPDIGKFTKDF